MRPLCAAAALALAFAAAAPVFAAVSLGVYLDGPNTPEIQSFFAATRQHAIVHYALVWKYSDANSHTTLMNWVRNAGATPMCGWGTGGNADGHGFQHIIDGHDDAYITSIANAVKAFGDPVIFAFCGEFNHSYNPCYYLNDPSHSTAKFAEMWRHVRQVFRNAGATNAQFAWCPNYQSSPNTPANNYNNYYPGDAYVDWVGTLGFDSNWVSGPAPISFGGLFNPILADFSSRYPKKPQIISWFATSGNASYKTSWIPASYGAMSAYPNLRAVVWFNDYNGGVPGPLDFRVWTTPGDPAVPSSVTTAYRNAVSSSPLFLTYLPPYDQLVPDGGGGGKLTMSATPSSVGIGDTLNISYAFSGIAQRVDAYLGVVMPDGTLMVMDSNLVFQPDIVPVAANFDVSGNPAGVLPQVVPGGIPQGAYTFEAVCVPAGRSVLDAGNYLGGGIVTSVVTVR